MLKEFADFIKRGNVIDLAVAVVIGGAFGAIVGSLVNDIIMPLIGIVIGGINFSALVWEVGSAKVMYGNFLQMVVNFLVIAWVVFIVVKAINQLKRKEALPPAPAPEPPPPPQDVILLSEIRDLLKRERSLN